MVTKSTKHGCIAVKFSQSRHAHFVIYGPVQRKIRHRAGSASFRGRFFVTSGTHTNLLCGLQDNVRTKKVATAVVRANCCGAICRAIQALGAGAQASTSLVLGDRTRGARRCPCVFRVPRSAIATTATRR